MHESILFSELVEKQVNLHKMQKQEQFFFIVNIWKLIILKASPYINKLSESRRGSDHQAHLTEWPFIYETSTTEGGWGMSALKEIAT